MLHAKHVWDNCASLTGEPVHHQGQYSGDIAYHGYTRDWVLIDWDSSGDLANGYTSGIYRSDHRRIEEVTAWYTENGVDNLASKNTETAYKEGIMTGTNQGQITGIIDLGFDCAFSSKAFRASIEGAGGDSGGPVFTESSEEPGKLVLIGMVNQGRTTTGGTDCNGDPKFINTEGFATWELDKNDGINPVTV